MSALKQHCQFRVAKENELFSISYNFLELEGTSNLSPRARRYLFFFVSLVKLGYTAVAAPMEALAAAIFRAQGQTRSVRTLRSALAELESAGYLHRNKYRIGDDHFRSVIILHTERFVYWTRKRSGNVVPITTVNHNSGYRQNLPKADLTTTPLRVNSQNSSESDNTLPRTHTRSNLNTKSHKFHPIIFTLMIVLKREPREQRNRLLSQAAHEIRNRRDNASGVDWDYWETRWPFMDHRPGGERENTAKATILPRLESVLCPRPSLTALSESRSPGGLGQNLPPPSEGRGLIKPEKPDSPETIKRLVRGFLDGKEPDDPPPPKETAAEFLPGEVVLDERELAVLTGARVRTKQARQNDREGVVFPNPSRLNVFSED